MTDMLLQLVKCIKGMNKLSRVYIKYGNMLVFALYFSALYCTLIAGKIGNFDSVMFFRDELLVCAKETASAVYVPAMLIETAVLAEKCDRKN